MSATQHDYKAEASALIATLRRHGFRPTAGNNGGEQFNFTEGAEFIEELCAADEAWLYLVSSDGLCTQRSTVYLVFGNEPGVIACDYSGGLLMEAAMDEHYRSFNPE